jgi:predicted secreted protein
MVRSYARKMPTTGDRLVENGPMLTMWALGAIIMFYLGWLASLTYLVFCIFSIIWFIRFICTYCVNSRTGYCESGLGNLGHSLFAPNKPRFFRRQFTRHIAIQFPIWFVPPIVAIYALVQQFSYVMLILLIIFCIIAFVVLPYESKQKVCDDCPMRYSCPWTNAKKKKTLKKGKSASEE